MHPAFSVISFTTLLGASQGLVVALGTLRLLGVEIVSLLPLLLIACALLIVSLGASFFHLGHPERAWRAAAMWKTSWLSREVIMLPLFIGLTGLWALFEWTQINAPWLIVLLIVLSFALWFCTAMIYACLKFIQLHPDRNCIGAYAVCKFVRAIWRESTDDRHDLALGRGHDRTGTG